MKRRRYSSRDLYGWCNKRSDCKAHDDCDHAYKHFTNIYCAFKYAECGGVCERIEKVK